MFAEYLDWAPAEHPSDDIMTQLMNVEFEDETGTCRTLRREEILTYLTVVAGAGNETTTCLIGWAGKVLGQHPDQRRELVDDPSLIPNAIEELLRFEHARAAHRSLRRAAVQCHGTTVPEGSAMSMLNGAANHDDRHFPDPERFDIHRDPRRAPHLRVRRALLPRCRVGAAWREASCSRSC